MLVREIVPKFVRHTRRRLVYGILKRTWVRGPEASCRGVVYAKNKDGRKFEVWIELFDVGWLVHYEKGDLKFDVYERIEEKPTNL